MTVEGLRCGGDRTQTAVVGIKSMKRMTILSILFIGICRVFFFALVLPDFETGGVEADVAEHLDQDRSVTDEHQHN